MSVWKSGIPTPEDISYGPLGMTVNPLSNA